MLYRAYTLPAL